METQEPVKPSSYRSLVVDHLGEPGCKPLTGLGYIYCDYRDQKEQTIENILGAILTQLLESLPEIPAAVLEIHEQRASERRPLSLEDSSEILRITCAKFYGVYVCLDALDELQPIYLEGLLRRLCGVPSAIQIFLTGRPHVQKVVQKFAKTDTGSIIEAHQSDIRRFVEHEIGGPNDLEPEAMDEKLRSLIIDSVVDSAEGIFLLPILQVQAVLQATTMRDREEALQKLPSNLGEAFAGTMIRIQQQPVALSERAVTITAWVHLAERPLNMNELLCSLAIKDGDSYFNSRGMPIRETLLNCCHGLVVMDQETSTVRLVHYSLEEYFLQQNRVFDLSREQWHSKFACTCLTFLKFPPPTEEDDETTGALLNYAATQWGHHLRRSRERPGTAFKLGKEYLNGRWLKFLRSLDLLYMEMRYYGSRRIILPAHIAAFFGLERMILHLRVTKLDLDRKDQSCCTPLFWAARYGYETVVKVSSDSSVAAHTRKLTDSSPVFPTPLLLAGEHGLVGIAKILVEDGPTVDVLDKDGQTPLSIAAKNGHERVVRILIQSGATVDLVDRHGRTPLSMAARNGHEAVVRILVENGATADLGVPSFNENCVQTPLSKAAQLGHKAVVRILIENGATVNSVEPDGCTALFWASKYGHEAIVNILIKKGAMVNSANQYGRTPLSYAAEEGYETVVKTLIENGAMVDSVDQSYGKTLLLLAAKNGHDSVMKMLIDNGVTVDSVDQLYGKTLLSIAAENGHDGVVKILIKNGVVMDSIDQYGQTPLSGAAGRGHAAVVKTLIENGATMDIAEQNGMTPLLKAVMRRHRAVIKTLIENGAHLDLMDQYDRTPLLFAVEKGDEAVIQMLIEGGAFLDSRDQFDRTPLSIAIEKRDEVVVKMLYEKGAAVDLLSEDLRIVLRSEMGYGE